MQFLVTAFNATDEGARQRRLDARPAHIVIGDQLVAGGEKLYGAAILSDAGDMIGSVAVYDFSDQDALDNYLAKEPYVTGKVWQSVDVRPCRRRPCPLPPFRPNSLPPESRT